MECAAFFACSLDGFIAREDGSLDWLDAANAALPAGEDCGFAAFFAGVDALAMGRHTYEMVASFPVWPYGDKPVHVLSSRPLALKPGLASSVAVASASPRELVARLSAQGCKRLYVDGGETLGRFLDAGLLDEITMTLIPVLLGRGRQALGGREAKLELLRCRTYPFGYTQSSYGVLRPSF